jgi:hypothetical protein
VPKNISTKGATIKHGGETVLVPSATVDIVYEVSCPPPSVCIRAVAAPRDHYRVAEIHLTQITTGVALSAQYCGPQLE